MARIDAYLPVTADSFEKALARCNLNNETEHARDLCVGHWHHMQRYWLVEDYWDGNFDTISDVYSLAVWAAHIPGHVVEWFLTNSVAKGWRFFELTVYGWPQAILGWLAIAIAALFLTSAIEEHNFRKQLENLYSDDDENDIFGDDEFENKFDADVASRQQQRTRWVPLVVFFSLPLIFLIIWVVRQLGF